MMKTVLVDAVLKKYGLPQWMREYIREYVKGADAETIKFAIGFVRTGRRKGTVVKDEIKLPNGKSFKKEQIVHFLSLTYFYEERLGEISRKWATARTDRIPLHEHHFLQVSDVENKRARAIKNLIAALGAKPGSPTQELKELLDTVEALQDWNERIIAKKLVLNYSFAKVYGLSFFRAFYPVSPEFMRSFGKVFYKVEEVETFGERDAERIVREGLITNERLAVLADSLLAAVARTIDAEAHTAKAAGIQREFALLRNIALAYPLYRLNELGVSMDVKGELTAVKRNAARKRNG